VSDADETDRATTGGSRVLVVVAQAIAGGQLRQSLVDHLGERPVVRVIAPALIDSPIEHVMGDVDEATVVARERLERSLAELERAGIEAEGAVGDTDVRLAIQDALQTFDADEIVIVAHREGGAYLERQGIEEAERDFDQPITELFIERGGDESEVADVERKPAGQPQADPEEVEGRSANFPPFSPRDILGIVVAVVGTVVLVILAASGGSGEDLNSGLGSQAVQILIAGVMGLINLAHVVGLTLFQAAPYRGFGRDLFARISLIGTPVAIIVSLLLS
jgi:hypothetical protein